MSIKSVWPCSSYVQIDITDWVFFFFFFFFFFFLSCRKRETLFAEMFCVRFPFQKVIVYWFSCTHDFRRWQTPTFLFPFLFFPYQAMCPWTLVLPKHQWDSVFVFDYLNLFAKIQRGCPCGKTVLACAVNTGKRQERFQSHKQTTSEFPRLSFSQLDLLTKIHNSDENCEFSSEDRVVKVTFTKFTIVYSLISGPQTFSDFFYIMKVCKETVFYN